VASDAPPADKTGGFDGNRAYAHVAKLVAIGPRPPGSEGIRRTQAYTRSQLESFGCAVEEDNFTAQTPVGPVAMKNIVATAHGKSQNVLLLLTHYDTRREPAGFVGANDGGSSTGVMLEMARHLCGRKNALSIWIAFLDGEEAFEEWSELDSLYGSRQMAARLAVSGDLKRIKAVLLADLVGYRELKFRRESNSTKWLTDLVWSTAERLGYKAHFADDESPVDDDHSPFLKRGVAAVDIIQLEDYPHWHTKEDTLDKISGRSLAIVGHVLLEVIPALEKKFR
jgi:Zn-dependent M28 family amino/carboxypeptidase